MSTLPEPDDYDRVRDEIRDGLRPVPAGWCPVCGRAPILPDVPGRWYSGTCADCYDPPDDVLPEAMYPR